MNVRAMEPADGPAYCALFQRVFARPPWKETWSLEEIARDLENARAKSDFVGLAADDGSGAIGFAAGYRVGWLPVLYLEQLFVDDRCQGAGTGSALLSAMLRRADGLVVLLTRPASSAEAFYVRRGFRRLAPLIRLRGKIVLFHTKHP